MYIYNSKGKYGSVRSQIFDLDLANTSNDRLTS